MPWLIPLTEWQAEVARRAMAVLARDNPRALAGFRLDALILTAPDDRAARLAFTHQGVWPVEFDLDAAVRRGEMTGQRKATLRKSMTSLELKVETPEYYRAKQT